MNEENKELVKRMYEDVINTCNFDIAEELTATDVIEQEKIPCVADGIG